MKRFITMLCCVLIVIGIFRVALGSYQNSGNFVPTYEDLINRFELMPDIPSMFYLDFLQVKNTFDSMTNSFTTINSLSSFFVAIGNFFKLIWDTAFLLADTILIPIKWLIWLMGTLFGYSA